MSEVVTVNGNWMDVDTVGEERVEDDPEILGLIKTSTERLRTKADRMKRQFPHPGLPCRLTVKRLPAAGRPRFDPWVGRSPGGGNGNLLQFLLQPIIL